MPQAGERIAREYLLPSVAAEIVQLFIALGADPDDRIGCTIVRNDYLRPSRRAHEAES